MKIKKERIFSLLFVIPFGLCSNEFIDQLQSIFERKNYCTQIALSIMI